MPAVKPPRPLTVKRSGFPWELPKYELADVSALQALQRGEASPDQQQRALNFITYQIAALREDKFFPGGIEGQRATDFALGKEFVARRIAYFLSINTGAFTKDGVSKSEHRPRGNP